MRKELKNNFIKNDYLIVVMIWLVFQLAWIKIFGFDFQGESLKYIKEANFFLENHYFSQQRYIFYSSTIFIIALSSLLKIGLTGAVSIVMLFNLLSYLCFYKALKTLFVSHLPALAVVVFLLFFWPYQKWSITLYSEGIYYSAVLLLFSLLIKTKEINLKFILSVLGINILLLLTRPMGILLVIPTLLFIYQFLSKRHKLIFVGAVIIVGFLFNSVMQIVFTTTKDWSMAQALRSDIIIADSDVIPVNKNIIVTNSSSQLYQLYFYLVHNFGHFVGLALKRLQAFFFLVRNYFSFAHNVFLLSPVVVMYGVIVFRFGKIKRSLPRPLFLFIFSSIFFYALAVALQFDDYHNRFFLTLMPFFTTATMIGLTKRS